MYLDHNVLLSGDYISVLRRWCTQFLHVPEIDQACHRTPKGDVYDLPKNLKCENLKFGQKFGVLEPVTSGLVGVSSSASDHWSPRQKYELQV